jgi:hypothetical protein
MTREFVDSREGFSADEDLADFERHLDAQIESARFGDANGELDYVGFGANVFNGFVDTLLQTGEMADIGYADEMLWV